MRVPCGMVTSNFDSKKIEMLSNLRFSSLTEDNRKATNSWIDGQSTLELESLHHIRSYREARHQLCVHTTSLTVRLHLLVKE